VGIPEALEEAGIWGWMLGCLMDEGYPSHKKRLVKLGGTDHASVYDANWAAFRVRSSRFGGARALGVRIMNLSVFMIN
jgi:hypothetical protein